jgi:hypothetical protein
LLYIPVVDRRWKEHFKEIRSPSAHAEKLLFYENEEELKDVLEDWNKHAEDSNLPWFTSQEYEQVFQDLRHLKSYDKEKNECRDLRVFEFTLDVLNKYRDNELCEVHGNYIAFLQHDKKKSASVVSFVGKVSGTSLTVLAKDFAFVPPREIRHWMEHQINAAPIDR